MDSGRRVAVLQSNYIPWKGYFDLIHDVELFIFYDDVQFTKNDWRNRNLLKTAQGPSWLSIPVGHHIHRLISEVRLPDGDWAARHWDRITACYGHAPFFALYKGFFQEIYARRWALLSEFNQHVTERIARDLLGIKVQFEKSSSFHAKGARLDHLLDLLEEVGASEYASGPAGKHYIDERRFQEAGIKLIWKDYSGYPEYPQQHPPFAHAVTILDLLFQTGPDAPRYIWGWRGQAAA